jgi:HSP20 family protein
MAMATKETDRKDLQAAEREPLLRPLGTVTELPDGNILLRLEMPGVSRENLEIDVDASELCITGRRAEPRGEGTFLVRERPRGSFRQVYTLDDTIDPAKIDAVLEAGVLNLTLHRKEAIKPRKIAVRS